MINYTTVQEHGTTRACFSIEGTYFEVPIDNVPPEHLQDYLQAEVNTFQMSIMSIAEMEAMQAAEADEPE